MGLVNFFNKIIENGKTPYIVLSVFGAILISPIIFIALNSFKSIEEVFRWPPTIFPTQPSLDAYISVFNSPVPLTLRNSVIISGGTTAIVLVASIFTAYSLSRFKFMGSDKLLLFFFATRVIPPISLVVPYYLVLNELRLLNTYTGLIIVYTYLSYPLIVWMLKAFFDDFPQEVIDAALVDGCSRTSAFFRVVLPLSSVGIAAAGIITFLWSWNEFLYAIIFTNTFDVSPVTIGIFQFVGDYVIEWNSLSAVGIFASLPAIIFFIVAQKYIIEGLTRGSLKF
jgi:ABC-type glycerol-3-phosphate transport system permease component